MADELLDALRSSKKYAAMDEKLMQRILEEERSRHSKTKDILKAAKNHLHQIHGAYAGDEGKALRRLAAEGPLCGREQAFLERHASTRERLPIAEEFFRTAFAGCPGVRSVLDLGCGLNPFFLPLMPASIERYTALDMDGEAAALLNRYFAERGLPQEASLADLVQRTPQIQADLAFLLKLFPVLEQQKKGRSLELLSELRSRVACVSFPLRSLSGKRKGMEESYTVFFEGLLGDSGWRVQEKRSFPGELLYVLSKG